jgi:MFS family permease
MKRKPFLLVYESITLLCSIIALLSSRSWLLSVVVIIAGFGRGANGAAGPFSPVEQAWLAEEVAAARRGIVFSLNTAYGFFGMGLGALLAMLPSFLNTWMFHHSATANVAPEAYRPLFLIVTIATIGNLFLIARAKEQFAVSRRKRTVKTDAIERELRKKENSMLAKLIILNSFNGIAIGLTGPLISYWFATRFHTGPKMIAPMMAATFFLTGVSSFITGKATQKIGIVKSVVAARSIGLVLLLLLPLMPYFWLASLVYLLRSAFNRGSVGARQALTVGLVRDKRRGFAISMNSLSMQVPRSVGPSVTGFLFSEGNLQLPFFLGAVFQAVYLVLYQRFFKKVDVAPAD